MREKQNPLKANAVVDSPARISICVLLCIPAQEGYFAEALDVFKLCLASIREHTTEAPYDLLVMDNGSCKEVVDYLIQLEQAQQIDYLILSKRNVGKANGQRLLLRAAPGDVVVFSDSDMYFRPGWLPAQLEILEAYPQIGEIGGQPSRFNSGRFTGSTLEWIESQGDKVEFQQGHLIPEAHLKEFASSLGLDSEALATWDTLEDYKVTYNGVSAFVGVAHQQFMIPHSTIEKIPHERFERAMKIGLLDETIDQAGLLQLSPVKSYVYHIGNRIVEPWLQEEFKKLVEVALPKPSKTDDHWFWSSARRSAVYTQVMAVEFCSVLSL